jgi:hypothetical protein
VKLSLPDHASMAMTRISRRSVECDGRFVSVLETTSVPPSWPKPPSTVTSPQIVTSAPSQLFAVPLKSSLLIVVYSIGHDDGVGVAEGVTVSAATPAMDSSHRHAAATTVVGSAPASPVPRFHMQRRCDTTIAATLSARGAGDRGIRANPHPNPCGDVGAK